MTVLVVDASVAVKWFVPEIHHDTALRLLDDRYDLLAPDLIAPEVVNTLWKKIRRHELTVEEGRDAVRLFSSLSLEIYQSRPAILLALEIALDTGGTVYDSVYLALAVVESCPMITADRKLYSRVKRSSFASNVLWVEDHG